MSTTPHAYLALLRDASVGAEWLPKTDGFGRLEDDSDQVPRVPFDVLGCADSTSALLAISFIGTMLSNGQGDDAEAQVLFTLLKDAASSYPDMVSLW